LGVTIFVDFEFDALQLLGLITLLYCYLTKDVSRLLVYTDMAYSPSNLGSFIRLDRHANLYQKNKE
jgi:hypothetical protein